MSTPTSNPNRDVVRKVNGSPQDTTTRTAEVADDYDE